MDRHLQFMLKQTEDYTKRLSKRIINEGMTALPLSFQKVRNSTRRFCSIPSTLSVLIRRRAWNGWSPSTSRV